MYLDGVLISIFVRYFEVVFVVGCIGRENTGVLSRVVVELVAVNQDTGTVIRSSDVQSKKLGSHDGFQYELWEERQGERWLAHLSPLGRLQTVAVSNHPPFEGKRSWQGFDWCGY